MAAVLAAILAIAAFRSSVRTGIALVFVSSLLIPTALAVPGVLGLLLVSRVVLLAFLAGLVSKAVAGEVPFSCFRIRRVHFAFAVLALVAWANGVVLNQVGNPFQASAVNFLFLVDQLLIIVATLAAARIIGGWRVLRIFGIVMTIAAVIGILERLLHLSSSAWFYRLLGETGRRRTRALAVRGEVRVRGAFAFALEFAWVLAVAFPLVLLWASRARRRLAQVAPFLVILAMLWTVSRSAPAGVALGLVVLVVFARDRFVMRVVLVGALLAGLFLVANPSVLSSYNEAHPDSADTRLRRIFILTSEVADRPYEGIGFARLQEFGFQGTDSALVLLYASTGVPGVVAYGLALLAAIATAANGVRARARSPVAAAALGAILAACVADLSTNLFFLSGLSKTFGIAVGLAAWASDPLVSPVPRPVRVRARALLPIAGVLIGILAVAVVPSRASATYQIPVLTIADYLRLDRAPGFVENAMRDTVCEVARVTDTPNASVECFDLTELEHTIIMRVEAATPERVEAAASMLTEKIEQAVPSSRVNLVTTAEGESTIVRTAPVWLGSVGLAAALLLPPWRRRRVPPAVEPETHLALAPAAAS
jgi:hypothetical protein